MYRFIFCLLIILFVGCNKNLSPFSPEINDKIENQNGKIEELKNNQNSMVVEILKLRQENSLMAEQIQTAQQGWLNINGDGGLMFIFGISTIAMLLVYHYRTLALRNEKAAEIIAQQINEYKDDELENRIFLAAMNSPVEDKIYELITKNQNNENQE